MAQNFVRDSNSSLKLLTFQLSDVRDHQVRLWVNPNIRLKLKNEFEKTALIMQSSCHNGTDYTILCIKSS